MEKLLRRLLGRTELDSAPVREALRAVEREERSHRVAVRRWERKRKQLLERMKRARSDGATVQVDSMWDEFKEHRREGNDLRLEGRAFRSEGLALRRTLRVIESLARRNDRVGARHLLERLSHSGVVERMTIDREERLRSLAEMNQILEEHGENAPDAEVDPEKAMFLAELDLVCRSESAGNTDEAAQLETELLERFQREEPDSAS